MQSLIRRTLNRSARSMAKSEPVWFLNPKSEHKKSDGPSLSGPLAQKCKLVGLERGKKNPGKKLEQHDRARVGARAHDRRRSAARAVHVADHYGQLPERGRKEIPLLRAWQHLRLQLRGVDCRWVFVKAVD